MGIKGIRFECVKWNAWLSVNTAASEQYNIVMLGKPYPPMFAFVWRKCSRHTSCLPKSQSQAYVLIKRERQDSIFWSTVEL